MAATCPPTTIFDCGESRRTWRHISRTLPKLGMMPEMPTMSYSVEVSSCSKALQSWEIEQRAGRGDVALDHHQSPGAVEHAQREAALRARDLVVIQLHGIDGAAAEFVVLRVGAEDRAQKHAGLLALGMRRDGIEPDAMIMQPCLGTCCTRFRDMRHVCDENDRTITLLLHIWEHGTVHGMA